ncbi:hypothetical protein Nepgr_032418 [Nepenthes gracilis]|uniref:Uncharacterized protein n=1 Tax=Nepenthes gracilis TaxID=150966 RepID=A0AAD3TIJ1_NEPGR|nr:hypothetical protein Nepgr_032418 [Nepenthes gracilis]
MLFWSKINKGATEGDEKLTAANKRLLTGIHRLQFEPLPRTKVHSSGMEKLPMMGRRIVLFPLPLLDYMNPMFQLAEILHAKGFSISIIHTNFNAPNPKNHIGFTFHPISDGLLASEASSLDLITLFDILNVKCVAPFRDRLSQMLSDALEEEPIACLITDGMLHFTQTVADSLKLPRLVLRTSNVSSLLAIAALPLLRQKGYLTVQDSQSELPVPELPPLKVKDIPSVRSSNSEAFFQLTTRVCKGIKASHGLIVNTFEELEDPAIAIVRQDFQIPVFAIGPFHKIIPASSSGLLTLDKSCIEWLNTQAPKSVLYVSFGSAAAIDEIEFGEIAWGLANSERPFLWVVWPGMVRGSKGSHPLPDGLTQMISGRAHIVKWAPQEDVLAHPATGGFWTHNGWNSTLESICEGVPMICLPFIADQMSNARYVTDVWNVGLRLEGKLERGEIAMTIRGLMSEKEGKEMRERAAFFKEKANLCLEEGGSSYKSLESLASHISSF